MKNKSNLAPLILKHKIFFGLACAALFFAILYAVAWTAFRDVPARFVEWDIPTEPVEKERYDYAHAIKLPDAVPSPQPFQFCKKEVLGLCFTRATPEEYWNHLCKTESGDFIFNTVQDVTGVRQLKPQWSGTTDLLGNSHRLEAPAQFAGGAGIGLIFGFEKVLPHTLIHTSGSGYDIVDVYGRRKGQVRLSRWTPSGKSDKAVPYDDVAESTISSPDLRYGFLVRGIRRERDREFRIGGDELIFIDTQSNRVLGIRRSFALARDERGYVDWRFGAKACPSGVGNSYYKLFFRVLVPARKGKE